MSIRKPQEIAETYWNDGFCFPIDVMPETEALGFRARFEDLQRRSAGLKLGNMTQLNYAHVIFRFAREIAGSARVLDAVEPIIGPDIMIWSSSILIKKPQSSGYVSWHQDLRYWGLEDHDAMVSAWLALSPVTRANGCMRFVPGSHKGRLVPHNDTYVADNILTRGQEAAIEIDERATRHVELRPGQMSLHHGRLLHASAPNTSDEWRIGYVMIFISPKNRQAVGNKDFAMLVRGEDRFGNFEQVPAPDADLSEQAMDWHARIRNAQNEAIPNRRHKAWVAGAATTTIT